MKSPNLPHRLIKTALIRKSEQHWDREITPEDIEDLGGSIEDEGLLHPIVVRKVGKMYELLAGARRFKVFRNRGEREISCTVIPDCDDIKARKISLEENLKTKKPTSAEWAVGIRELHELVRNQILEEDRAHPVIKRSIHDMPKYPTIEKKSNGRPKSVEAETIRVVAKKVGVAESTVRSALNQEKLISTARHSLEQGKISLKQANALAGMTKEDQRIQLSQMVRETREQTQDRMSAERIQTPDLDKSIREAIRAFGRLLGSCELLQEKVDVFRNNLTDPICHALYRESRDSLVNLHKATSQLLQEIESAEKSR